VPMHLSSFAERTRFAELQAQARTRIAEAARARGLGPDDLADRLVPDLDLDPDGSKLLSFGARAFRVGFDEHLDPFVRDEAGALLRSLPRPAKADDADRARAAQETWKAIKTDAAAIAGGQIQRLEQAMITGRRWPAATFRSLLLGHPLLVHLVRRLLFGAYDAGGRLLHLFRVAEDRSFADVADAPLALDGDEGVGLPHPIDLPPAVLAPWGSLFADYEILQPFAQIGREVFTPTEAERTATAILRFQSREVETGKLFGLEHRGWRRASGDRIANTYRRELPAGYYAWLHVSPGVNLATPQESPVQTIGAMRVFRSDGADATMDELSPVAFSELVRDVALLVG